MEAGGTLQPRRSPMENCGSVSLVQNDKEAEVGTCVKLSYSGWVRKSLVMCGMQAAQVVSRTGVSGWALSRLVTECGRGGGFCRGLGPVGGREEEGGGRWGGGEQRHLWMGGCEGDGGALVLK